MINIKNIISFLAALFFSFTLPGTNSISFILGPGIVKLVALILLISLLNTSISLLKNKDAKSIIILIFLLVVFSLFNSYSYNEHSLLGLISLIWMIIVISNSSSITKFKIFLVTVSVPLVITVLSAGVAMILNLNREIVRVGSREILAGSVDSYVIYSTICLTSFFFLISVYQIVRSSYIKIILLFFIITSFVGSLTSGSRGGMIATISGVLIFSYFYIKEHNLKRIKGKKLILLGLLLLIYLIPWNNIYDALFRESINEGSTGTRLSLMIGAFELFLESPLWGNGWLSVLKTYKLNAHSGFLQLLAELGIIGFVLESLIFYRIFKIAILTYRTLCRNQDQSLSLIALSLLSLLGAFFIWEWIENFGFVFGTRILYLIAALIISLSLIVNRQKPLLIANEKN